MQDTNNYYELQRTEILEFVPEGVKRTLDIGCGGGIFSSTLKSMRAVEVWGVEPEPKAAKLAEERLDKVISGSFEEVEGLLPVNYFDCIFFNDVLEHMSHPKNTLNSVKKHLNQQGIVIASIPNVRYFGNLKELLVDRDWEYKDAGILDDTHVRFFTKKSMLRMFNAAGYDVLKITGINPITSLVYNILNTILLGKLSDAKFLQYVVVAKVKK